MMKNKQNGVGIVVFSTNGVRYAEAFAKQLVKNFEGWEVVEKPQPYGVFAFDAEKNKIEEVQGLDFFPIFIEYVNENKKVSATYPNDVWNKAVLNAPLLSFTEKTTMKQILEDLEFVVLGYDL